MNDKGTKENATNVPVDKIIATVVFWLEKNVHRSVGTYLMNRQEIL